jgi:hypothetical protein
MKTDNDDRATVGTDWRGEPVPENELPETRIKWWEVDPHPTHPGYVLVERSWQRMTDFVGSSLDLWLEIPEESQLAEGVTMRFRVVEGTAEQYEEESSYDEF